MNHLLELTALLGLILYALTFLFSISEAGKVLRVPLGEILDEWFGEDRFKAEECRMCSGVWLTAGLFLALWPTPFISWSDFPAFLAGYGLSYFMATQER